MFNELALKIEEYLNNGSNFAIAQVIDRIAPSSGKVGDKAIILESGELIGWIGGGCVRGIIVKEAIEVIKRKRYKKIRISPTGGTSENENFKEYVMSCQSQGTVEVLIEPVIAQPELIIVGKSNIARKLAIVASAADFRVHAMAEDVDSQMFPSVNSVIKSVDFKMFEELSNTYIIVTTQGENDDLSVKKALETNCKYVGFVASTKKAEDIKSYLIENGISEDHIAKLNSPVGLDINAKLASEVAISILAEIIDDFRNGNASKGFEKKDVVKPKIESTSNPKKDTFSEEFYINPVCGVPVSKISPKHILEHLGNKVYFCCDGCKVTFEKNPKQYIN